MKALKKISMAMIAVLMSVSFVACNPDDNSTEDLKGRWYTKTESVNNLLIINDDNSVVSFKVSNYESWENVKGNLTVDGNEISIYFEDGNSLSGTCTMTDNILTINTTNG
ncbi:MAG: hypothetical protein IJ961_02140, partial [Bacteroidales bacterium]|nr:hypothetical protein [Bacteroidales bacterium]